MCGNGGSGYQLCVFTTNIRAVTQPFCVWKPAFPFTEALTLLLTLTDYTGTRDAMMATVLVTLQLRRGHHRGARWRLVIEDYHQ